MNMHISGTWFWANLLHPVLLFLYIGNSSDQTLFDLIGGYFSILLFSLIFSYPALWISFLWVNLISLFSFPAIGKYIFWMFSAPLMIMLNIWLISLLLTGCISSLEINFALPAMIAAEIIILIRYNQFINFINQLKKTRHENNLV